MKKGYLSIKSQLEYKIEMLTKTYKKLTDEEKKEKIYKEFLKVRKELDQIEKIINDLYYWMQNAYNLDFTLHYIKEKNLNIKATLKYIDYRVKKMTGFKGCYYSDYKLKLQKEGV